MNGVVGARRHAWKGRTKAAAANRDDWYLEAGSEQMLAAQLWANPWQ